MSKLCCIVVVAVAVGIAVGPGLVDMAATPIIGSSEDRQTCKQVMLQYGTSLKELFEKVNGGDPYEACMRGLARLK
jgi:hypothetical protein